MNAKKSFFTVKNVIRILLVLAIIFVFCPAFMVSCSEKSYGVSAMTSVAGVRMMGESVYDPNPVMLISLLLPIAALVVLGIRKIDHDVKVLITIATTFVDFIVWIIYCIKVKNFAEENFFSFKITPIYVLIILNLILIIITCVMCLARIVRLETDLNLLFSNDKVKNSVDRMSVAVEKMSDAVAEMRKSNGAGAAIPEDRIGFCSECGAPILFGNKFCNECGTPVSESLIAKAQESRRKAEEERLKKEAEEERQRQEAEEKARIEEEERKRAEEERQRQEAEEKARREEEERIRAEEERKRAEQEVEMNSEDDRDTILIGSGMPASEETERPNFCYACGTKLGSDDLFCSKCGTKVD